MASKRPTSRSRVLRLRDLLFLALCPACAGDTAERPQAGVSLSPSARPEIVESLREGLAAERHPADGGGRAWLETDAGSGPVVAAGRGRWTVVYEAGEHGVAENGWIFFQAPPFWNWSTPQAVDPDRPGYTAVSSEAEGVVLEPLTLDSQLLGIRVRGRALAPGERVRIVYGDGPAGALADSYAERATRFWVAVDGDGDGVRATLSDRLEVDIAPADPARLVLNLPSTARPGATVRLTVAVLDAAANAGVELSGRISLESEPAGLALPEAVELEAGDGGRKTVELKASEDGVYRVLAEGPEGLTAESNPLVVSAEGWPILWGDLHGHSGLSDGTGTPADYFAYARDVAGLDVAALTDHDHWGMEPLALHPELWEAVADQVARFHEPGRFVTLLGYEWTSWLHGHRHVLYFGDRGEVYDSVDPDYETPPQLWAALRGQPALTFAHHSAGGPVATNWDYAPDPELEPVTEIVSVHGSSEAMDSPRVIYSPVAGNFVRDVLDRGHVLGFVGSGDSHDGHPGLAHLVAPSGGLAAILSETPTRAGVLEALRERRVYATNGPRIVLRAALGGRPMGSTLTVDELRGEPATPGGPAPDELRVLVFAPGALERIDLVRGGSVRAAAPCGGERSCSLSQRLGDVEPGEYVYLRAIQEDGGAAWSSPFFVRNP